MIRKRFPNLKAAPKKRGPKRIFTSDDLRAIEHLSKLGATDAQVANYFQVHIKTVEYWMRTYPDYKAARKRGGLEADMNVAQSLYLRAVGIHYVEEEYTAIEIDGVVMPMDEMVRVKRVKKWLPPDTKAATRWLALRQKEAWAVVPEAILRHTGNVNHTHRKLQDIPIQELSEPTQQMVFEVVQKMLSADNREN